MPIPLSKIKLAKELYEICCYPDPTPWKDISQDEKDVWIYRADILRDSILEGKLS
jgi:hypothetical protein